MKERAFNFSAGPATLPLSVLQQAGQEISNWQESGMGVMEMSHRGSQFMSIYEQAQADFRQLLRVPDNYQVIFAQGGAQAQNAIIPMNIGQYKTIDFFQSGVWSDKSLKEAKKYSPVKVVAEINHSSNSIFIPEFKNWKLTPEAAYLHICSNETIQGIEFQQLPSAKQLKSSVPLVVDCSSNIMSRSMDWSNIGLAFAGAQKNIGCAGLTIVVIRDDLINKTNSICPSVFDYRKAVDNQSMLNTPPTWSIYVAGLVFKWLKQQGGVVAIEEKNIAKAKILYNYIDNSSFYTNNVASDCRSRMNVPFTLAKDELNAEFLAQANQKGLLGLKGHKAVGGMRASMYNAMPIEGVKTLISFMQQFEKNHR